MSGGGITDGTTGLWVVEAWADRIRAENPLLAENLEDLKALLDRYDCYLAGDIGCDSIEESWAKYRFKWMSNDDSKVMDEIMDECRRIVESSLKGWRESRWNTPRKDRD